MNLLTSCHPFFFPSICLQPDKPDNVPLNRSRRPVRRFKDWGAIGDALLAAEAEDEGAAECLQKSCLEFEDMVDGAYVQTKLARGEHINLMCV